MTRDPDSGRPRPVHRDFTGREATRPGPHVEDLEATDDERPAPFVRECTPVDALDVRLSRVEVRTVEIESALSRRSELPDTEWALRHDATVADLGRRVAVCEEERAARTRWAPVIKWAKGIGAGSAVAVVLWAGKQVADSGAAAESSRRDRESLRAVVDDVRKLQLEFAADHARLQILLEKLGVKP